MSKLFCQMDWSPVLSRRRMRGLFRFPFRDASDGSCRGVRSGQLVRRCSRHDCCTKTIRGERESRPDRLYGVRLTSSGHSRASRLYFQRVGSIERRSRMRRPGPSLHAKGRLAWAHATQVDSSQPEARFLCSVRTTWEPGLYRRLRPDRLSLSISKGSWAYITMHTDGLQFPGNRLLTRVRSQ